VIHHLHYKRERENFKMLFIVVVTVHMTWCLLLYYYIRGLRQTHHLLVQVKQVIRAWKLCEICKHAHFCNCYL
jgi:hypothetical protein